MFSNGGIFAGIDFGTSNSCIAVYVNEKAEVFVNPANGSRLTPSVVYIEENGEIHVGENAKKYGNKKPERFLYDSKRMLTIKNFRRNFHKNYELYLIYQRRRPVVKIIAQILKKMASYVGTKIDGIVLTVPASFSSYHKTKMLEAAKIADLNVLQLICEPTAAAIAYGMEHSYINGEMLFVFDMGGGTLDITVLKVINSLQFNVITLGGVFYLGGRDFDDVITEWMEKNLEKQVGKVVLKDLTSRKRYKLMEMAQKAKEALSQAEDVLLQLSEICFGAKDITLTRTEFEELSTNLMERVKECIRGTLNHPDVEQQKIDHVLFIGGASKMPMVSNLLKEFFSEAKFSKTVDADEIVALGATIFAANLAGVSNRYYIRGIQIQDVTSLMICVEVRNSRLKPVFAMNSPYGDEKTVSFTTSEKFQQSASVDIYEGFNCDIEDCIFVGSISVMDLPKVAVFNLSIRMKIDHNGIVRARIDGSEFPATIEREIVGTDLGNTSCCNAVVRYNGIETVSLENTGARQLKSYVSYDEQKVKCGKIVLKRMSQHSESSVFDIKKFVGKIYDDVKIDQKWPFQVVNCDKKVKIQVKTLTGNVLKDPEDIIADLIKHIKNESEQFQGRQLNETVITVPMSFNVQQKEAIRKAAIKAGWENVYFLPDPIAAIFAYFTDQPISSSCNLLTFDLGGSSLEICVFKLNNGEIGTISTYSNMEFGGKDFDNVIRNYIEERIKNCSVNSKTLKHKLNEMCEEIKSDLTQLEESEFEYYDDVGEERIVSITRKQFEELSQDLISQIRTKIANVLKEVDYKHSQINAILQIGGGCRMPIIKKLLHEEFPVAQHFCDNKLEEVVATGAAQYAYNVLLPTQKKILNQEKFTTFEVFSFGNSCKT